MSTDPYIKVDLKYPLHLSITDPAQRFQRFRVLVENAPWGISYPH